MATEQTEETAVKLTESEHAEEQELSDEELEGISGGNYNPGNIQSQNSNWASQHTGGDGSGSHYGE